MVEVAGSQKILEWLIIFSTFIFTLCSQIWLNLPKWTSVDTSFSQDYSSGLVADLNQLIN
jgi:hypothetical protein